MREDMDLVRAIATATRTAEYFSHHTMYDIGRSSGAVEGMGRPPLWTLDQGRVYTGMHLYQPGTLAAFYPISEKQLRVLLMYPDGFPRHEKVVMLVCLALWSTLIPPEILTDDWLEQWERPVTDVVEDADSELLLAVVKTYTESQSLVDRALHGLPCQWEQVMYAVLFHEPLEAFPVDQARVMIDDAVNALAAKSQELRKRVLTDHLRTMLQET